MHAHRKTVSPHESGWTRRITARALLLLVLIALLGMKAGAAFAQTAPSIVVLSEPGFPTADSAPPPAQELKRQFHDARFADTEHLRDALADSATHLLVLPYGSAFPETAWPEIHAFLERGGNLLVIGGAPFTRAAYRDAAGWHLREASNRVSRELLIDQYDETPGSAGLEFQTNPDVVLQTPRFEWLRAFSPILHLTSEDLYARDGSAGALDARIDVLAWGAKDGRRISVPALQIDHIRNRFAGGRWLFLNADLPPDFFGGGVAEKLLPEFAAAALRGSEEFIVHPVLPLYLPGEPVEVVASWQAASKAEGELTARITVHSELEPMQTPARMVKIPAADPIVLPSLPRGGLYTIDAELFEGKTRRAVYHSGFWVRDEAMLRSGPRLSVNHDYFELDGKPLAVIGTTYMASDVQRLFFEHPNVYVWDHDLAQIQTAGLNMIRTGWWTGWDKFCDEEGRPNEQTLRTLEAFLMTTRRHGLPVQFNFFAFLPEVLGGANAYLDPEAVRRQSTLVAGVAQRFRDVPYLAWDLINEPSFSQHVWQMRPNGDGYELAQWNRWLSERYKDREALAAAWNLPPGAADGTLAVPPDAAFAQRAIYAEQNPLPLYDFFLFAQESFADWVKHMREAIRAAGSQQPITVGQDEGGFDDRLSPAFFGGAVDFTTNHSWWNNDALLWDSLVAKQPGLPMLIQETGIQRELAPDGLARRTPEGDAALLERKIALSFVQGSGAIEWLWNSNDYMTSGNEVPIGALRADGTEKPEAGVLRNFAAFARSAQPSLRNPVRPGVAIVTSQAEQFSAERNLQIEAQRKAVRAMDYNAHMPAYVIAENQIAKLGTPRLVVLPSAQALADATWQALLAYVKSGGNLLITGPIERDAHWHRATRAADLHIVADLEPLTFRNAQIQADGLTIPFSFDAQAQSWLEMMRFDDGSSFKTISHGAGRVFWAAYPVELAEGLESAEALYSFVLRQVGLAPRYELKSKISPGVLIYPIELEGAVLYVMESEINASTDVDLRDMPTGVEIALHLAPQRAALAVISKSSRAITARFGF